MDGEVVVMAISRLALGRLGRQVDSVEQTLVNRVHRFVFDPRILRFGIVGLSGVLVNLGFLYLLSDLWNVEDTLSSAMAIEVSIIWNFLLNNSWTFRDRNELARVGFTARLFRYNMVSLLGLGIQLAAFVILTRSAQRAFALQEPGIWKYPAQLAGIGLAMAWNFMTNFFWTWAQTSESGDDAAP